jgi:predicted metal-dependent hydrolase
MRSALFSTPEVTIRRSRRARRLTLRLAAQGEGIVVTAPPRASQREILGFVERNRAWLDDRLAQRPDHTTFHPGSLSPIRGMEHRLEITGSLRGHIVPMDGVLRVPCLAEHMPRRVKAWLRVQARQAIGDSLRQKAALLNRPMPPFALRDTTSRWGSCSSQGRLSFSWRLILAPPEVLDYVVGHEAAHLMHMNHGPEFWALCQRVAPQTPTARTWLKANGARLHRYG